MIAFHISMASLLPAPGPGTQTSIHQPPGQGAAQEEGAAGSSPLTGDIPIRFPFGGGSALNVRERETERGEKQKEKERDNE